MNIVEKLLRKNHDPIGEGLVREWYVNPDGPEAAEILDELGEVLSRLGRLIAQIPAWKAESGRINEVLTKLRGQS